MWVVYEHRRVPRQIRSLPEDILKRYEKWKDIVAISGPIGLRLIKGFHDESLRGEWKGHRSSRLGRQIRVIYRIEKDQILVQVVNVTAHDYRKK
jgi:mRNA-degrading endonuclease YafQ of YafQ-DinJ toxin-antitoxin module